MKPGYNARFNSQAWDGPKAPTQAQRPQLWESPGMYNCVQQPQPGYGNMGPNVNPQNSNPQGIPGGAKQGMYFGNVPSPQGMPQSQITRPDWNQNPAPQNIGPMYPPNQLGPNDGGVGYLNSLEQNPGAALGYGTAQQANNTRPPYLQPGSSSIAPIAPLPPMPAVMAQPASSSAFSSGYGDASTAISPISDVDAFAGYNPLGSSPFQTDVNLGGSTSLGGNNGNFSSMYDLGNVNPNATADMAADTAAFNGGTGVYDPSYKPPGGGWGDGMTMGDWGNAALGGIQAASGLMQAFNGWNQNKQSAKQFKQGQENFESNFNNQAQANNTYMRDRQVARNISSNGRALNADEYMAKNKVQGI